MSICVHDGLSENTLPVCLFKENPNRLVSLWDMLQIYADKFVDLLNHIRDVEELERIDYNKTAAILRFIQCGCPFLRSAVKQAARIEATAKENPELPSQAFADMFQELRTRIIEDYDDLVLLQVDDKYSHRFYKRNHDNRLVPSGAEDIFGEQVCDAFRSSIQDLKESIRCISLNRPTAGVFHLMRALEIPLTLLAAEFNVSAARRNWAQILQDVEKEIRKMGTVPTKAATWKEDQEFYSQCADGFVVLKDAWRNLTAHANGLIGEDDATEILESSKAFLKRLSTRLREPDPVL